MRFPACVSAVLAFAFAAACGGSKPATANFHSPPVGHEKFEPTGILFVLESPDWPVERARRVSDLSENETKALRHFIDTADYVHYTELHADHANVPVVRVDGVYWWVYRSSMYRVGDGDRHYRKSIDNLRLAYDYTRDELDLEALMAWYEASK